MKLVALSTVAVITGEVFHAPVWAYLPLLAVGVVGFFKTYFGKKES